MSEEIATLREKVVEHDAARLPGITRVINAFPDDEKVGAFRRFSDVLDLVDRVPDAISEIGGFFHLGLGSNHVVGAQLDAGEMDDGIGASEAILELESEIGEDARNTSWSNPVGRHCRT